MNEQELKHYGVLGMKWGVRRAERNVSKAASARKSAKQLTSEAASVRKSANRLTSEARALEASGKKRKARKLMEQAQTDADKANKLMEQAQSKSAKANKYANKAKKIEDRNRKRGGDEMYDYVKKASTGKMISESLMLGSYGAMKYHQSRFNGESKGKAVVKGMLYNAANNFSLGLVSALDNDLD